MSDPTFGGLLVVKIALTLAVLCTLFATVIFSKGISGGEFAHEMVSTFNFVVVKIIHSTKM